MAEFWTNYGLPTALIVAHSVALIVILLIIVAFILYADRKVWAAVQMRRGPNVVGPFGLWQSFADLLKFVFKEVIIPAGSNKGIFLLAPVVTAGLAISAWAVMPVNKGWAVADINVGVLYIFAISSLQVYGVIIAGWASNSKYAFLAALRSAAQMVSYEVSIGFVIITALLCAGSLNLTEIVMAQDRGLGLFGWYWLPLFPMFVIYFISCWPRPTGRPSTCSRRNRSSWPGSWSNTPRPPTCCSCWASTSPSSCFARSAPCSSWAAGCRHFRWRPSPGYQACYGSC